MPPLTGAIDRRVGRFTRRLLLASAAWNIVQNTLVPRRLYGVANGIATVGVMAAARRAGLGVSELGTGEGFIRRGLRAAAVPCAVLVSVIAAGSASSRTRHLFRDERVHREGAVRLLAETAWSIPVGTVLFEEMLFRGALYGAVAHTHGDRAAVATTSAWFGVWHVLPTFAWARLNASAPDGASSLPRSPRAAVGAGVAITTAAGWYLAELRRRSDSVAAPMIVHAATNIGGYLAAWVAAEA